MNRLENFRPWRIVNDICDVDICELREMGIRMLIVDVDGTIVETNSTMVQHTVWLWIDKAKKTGFTIVLTSNNHRGKHIATIQQELGLHQVVFGHPLPRPFTESILNAMTLLLPEPERNEVVFIGDSLITDIWPGNRLGLWTILVKPLNLEAEEYHPLMRLGRLIESQILFPRLNLKFPTPT